MGPWGSLAHPTGFGWHNVPKTAGDPNSNLGGPIQNDRKGMFAIITLVNSAMLLNLGEGRLKEILLGA